MSARGSVACRWVAVDGAVRRLAQLEPERRAQIESPRSGVFETMRLQAGRLLRWERHLARLQRSATALALPLPQPAPLCAARDRLLERAGPRADGVVRVVLTPRRYWLTLEPPRPAPADAVVLEPAAGLAADPGSRTAGHKILERAVWDAARARAQARGAWDVLLLDRRGQVCEGSVCNVFWVRGRSLFTPPLDLGILPGVVRHEVLEIAPALGWPVRQVRAPLTHLLEADEAFVTNALIGVVAVRRIGTRRFAQAPGRCTRALAAALAAGGGRP